MFDTNSHKNYEHYILQNGGVSHNLVQDDHTLVELVQKFVEDI
jgi:hypothetical protein